MVRGPMMAEVTPGCRRTKAMATSIRLIPASSASVASWSAASSLRWFSGRNRSEAVGQPLARLGGRPGGVGVFAVAAGQPAAGKRAVGQHTHAVALADRQDLVLDAAGEDRVGGGVGD